jgi:hypothetical protein
VGRSNYVSSSPGTRVAAARGEVGSNRSFGRSIPAAVYDLEKESRSSTILCRLVSFGVGVQAEKKGRAKFGTCSLE